MVAIARRLGGCRIAAITTISLFSSACLEQCAPALVGEGVAQLTIRNSGAIIELINADTVCGFESPQVKSAVWVDGEPGKIGTATWTVTECEIDLRETPQVGWPSTWGAEPSPVV